MLDKASSPGTTGSVDPIELWKRWNETTSKVWLSAVQNGAEATTNSSSLYQAWMQSIGDSASKTQEQIPFNPFQMMKPTDAWKTWFDATMETWRKAAETGGDPLGLTRQWLKMMEEAQSKLLAGNPLQTDPFTLFKQWYDVTSEQWSKVVEETLGSKQFLESTRPLLESSASISLAFRRANEEYLKRLQIPTISDLANVATLVINLEEKIDKIEDSLENFEDTYANIATTEAVTNLGQRLDKVATTEMLASLGQRLNQVATNEMVTGLAQRLNQVATTEVVTGLEQRLDKLATTETTAGLEQRLNQIESKLEKVLTALEKLEEKRTAEPAPASEGTTRKAQKKSTGQPEIQQ